MALDPTSVSRMQELREKSKQNTLTMEDMKEIIVLMRQGRVAAAATSAKAKATKSTATAKKNINSDDLLSELDGLGS